MTRPTEVERALAAYVARRERIDRGESRWVELAELFTPDAVFLDPHWGRIEGREDIALFLERSMHGLDGWTFPIEWTLVDGDRAVVKWQNRLPGADARGRPYETPGISVLEYGRDGCFAREEDLLDLTAVFRLVEESGWRPSVALYQPPLHR